MSINPSTEHYIDLRGTPCPTNFIRCSLALEKIEDEEHLLVDIDKGEPELMVLQGLKEAGYFVQVIIQDPLYLRLKVTS